MWKRPISFVVIVLVAFIVAMYLVVISVMEGFKNHYMDKIQSVLAHVTVDVGQFAWGIEHPDAWSAEIAKSDAGIKGVTVGLETPAMILFNSARTIGTLRGIDLANELKVGRLGEVLQPANLTAFGTRDIGGKSLPGCIVGGALRKQYGLKLGGQVSFIFSDEDDDPRTVACAIVGFFEGKNPYLEQGAYVDRAFLAEKIKVAGRAKTLYLWLKEPNRPDLLAFKNKIAAVMQAIVKRDHAEMADKVNVETWQEKENNFYKAVTRENLMMRAIMAVFLALTAFIIFLIFGRLVAEKVRDIGALRALGASPGGIMKCFLIQGFFIGALGLGLGLGLTELILLYMNEVLAFLGVNIYPADAFAVDRIPYVTLPLDRILIALLTLASALLGALFPAWRAARLNPVECLRHE